MAVVRPFRALRYDPRRSGGLSTVLSPPYDVIEPDEQERLYQASPHNIVRLILGKQSPDDTQTDNRYTRAARDFDAWLQAGVLRRDAAPAFYLVEHQFEADGAAHTRLGFLAVLEFTDPIERSVLRHEKTLAAPKEDRTKLLDAVPANLEPIFCVYPDEDGGVQAMLQAHAAATAPDGEGALHGQKIRLWAVTRPDVVERITAAMAPSAMLIADGHHRFEVAYSRRSRFNGLMAYFSSMADPALVVRPIHRAIASGRPLDSEAMRGFCAMEPASDLAGLTGWLAGQEGSGRFGWSDGKTFYRLTVKPERLNRWLESPTVPKPLARLDVSLLHGLLLPGLGFSGATVKYTADAQRALNELNGAGAVWVLRGIPLADVYTIAAQGLTLQPKSTYFYPKVPSGLTINPLS
jgi:uncharacterized protein (DUF1015 family)